MRRNILLSTLSVIGLSALVFLYDRSKDELTQFHSGIVEDFQQLEFWQTVLEKDVLLARAFLLPDYDNLVEAASRQRERCNGLTIEKVKEKMNEGGRLAKAASELCAAILGNQSRIEEFKSKQAVLKNSVQYLSRENEQLSGVAKELSYSALNYYFFPADLTRANLTALLEKTKRRPAQTESGKFFLRHVETVLTRSDELKHILDGILSSGIAPRIQALKAEYAGVHTSRTDLAADYRTALLAVSALLLFFCVLNVYQILRAGDALALANSELEMKVRERTNELQESLKVISEQKATLIQSSKLSALGEMAGGVAHEINTPLAVISLQAECLSDLVKDDEKDWAMMESSIGKIKTTVTRIAKIIDGLRRFSRDGRADPMEELPAKQVVDDAIALCAEKLKSRSVSLNVDYASPGTKIRCRPVEISQVLLNLLSNSHDAIEPLAEKWIRVLVREDGEEIEISVIDSGTGVPAAAKEKIFQPFYTTKEIGRGTGLGLSISKGIAEAHGGRLFLDESSPNTKFTLRLKRSA